MARRKGIDFPPAPKKEDKPFDPVEFAEKAKQDHAALKERLSAMGVKPEDIPNVMKKAEVTLKEFEDLYNKMEAEKDPAKKERLIVSMRKKEVTLNKTHTRAEEAAREHLKIRSSQATAPAVEPQVQDDVEAPQYKGHIIGDGQLGEIPEGHNLGSAPQEDETRHTEPEPADEKLQEFRDAEAKGYNEKQEVEPMPAVFRSNRKRPENGEPKTEKEKMEFPLDSIKDIVSEQLRGKARIDLLDITETPEGLQLHAELDAGMMGGKIVLNGNIVNSGDTIAVEGLDIEARGYVKSMIENNLSGFAGAIESYFERQHGKPVSSIHVGGSGLAVEFDASPTEAETGIPVVDEAIEPGKSEGTPKEWREKLRGLIEGAKEKLGMSERGERLKNYLAERSKELHEKAKEYGPKAVEFVGSLSEKYNTLNWKTKLVLTGGLVVGVSFTSTTLPLVSALLGGVMYGQRVIGGIGFAMNRRKALDAKIAVNPSHWLAGKSERTKNAYAAALAAAYMGGTALAVHEGVEALNALGVNEWLGNMLGHPAPAPEAPAPAGYAVDTGLRVDDTVPVSPAGAEAATPDVSQSAAATSEMPSVQATPGKGYEYMVKRLWEDLHSEGVTLPKGVDPDSDLGQLLKIQPGDEAGINKLVHDLASDSERGFFNPDGTSVRVDLGSQMTVDADGNIRLNDMLKAPEGAPVTPVYPAEAPAVQLATETPAVQDLPSETVATSDMAPGLDLTAEQDLAQKQIDTASEAAAQQSVTPPTSERLVWKDGSGDIVRDGSGQPVYAGDFGEPAHVAGPEAFAPAESMTPQPTAPEESSIPETSTHPALGEVNPDFKVNALGLPVDITHANAYLDAQGNMIVFGGTVEERAQRALELVAKDPSAVVYFDSSRPGLFGLYTEHHISRAYMFEGSGNVVTPPGTPIGEAVTVQHPTIVDDTIEPALRGKGVPTVDDLKELYKPGSPKP